MESESVSVAEEESVLDILWIVFRNQSETLISILTLNLIPAVCVVLLTDNFTCQISCHVNFVPASDKESP